MPEAIIVSENSDNAEDAMSWTVGKMKISKVVEIESIGSTKFILPQASNDDVRNIPWLMPDYATEEGRLRMAIQSWIVETPGRKIIIDTCVGNDKQNRMLPAWNNLDKPFLQDIAAAGAPAESVNMVICTHLHVDHVGWNTRLADGKWVPTFTNARYVFGKREYEHWKADRTSETRTQVFEDSVQPIVDAGLADLVASDAQLTDDITLIPTPGHSPDHMSILFESDGQQALFVGDVAHHPIQLAHLDWSSTADSDQAQSAETRRQLFSRFADTPVLVFGGHFGPGYLKRDGDAFKITPEMH
jgi:glyoxylase-like metal-dependent hydrolase (beta-lactamase superfamily II)